MSTEAVSSAPSSTLLQIGLWTAQVVLTFLYCGIGAVKLFTPIPKLAETVHWAPEYPLLVRTMGVVDIAGGLGVLLPALTRILPGLTPLAALCCTVLQVCAMIFHGSRGEFNELPLNLVLISLSIFVFRGRGKKLPIMLRS